MIEINVKVRSGTQTLFDTKVLVNLEDPVSVLKKKLCEKHEELQEPLIEAFYCGCVLEDCNPIHTYDLFRGATVHVFKKNPTEKPTTPKPLAEADLVKLAVAIRSFTVNQAYRNSMIKHTAPEEIFNIISHVPELSEDPVAISFLMHSELLVKLGDFEDVKRLAQNHPALASAIVYLASIAHEEVLQAQVGDDFVITDRQIHSDEDMEDTDDSFPTYEASSLPVSSNSSFRTITAEQVAMAIASVNQPSQPSTSGASTSTINNRNIHGNTMTPDEVSTSLQIMREMGLTDEALNIYTLRETNDLETAVDLILNGFGVGDAFEDRT